jgi:hypothetical protein
MKGKARKTETLTRMLMIVGVLTFASCGKAQMPMMEGYGFDRDAQTQNPQAAGPGAGFQYGLPRDIQRSLIQRQIKFLKDNAALYSDLAQKQLELRLLWLDSVPNTNQLAAKMDQINQDQLKLQQNMLSAQLGDYNLLPGSMRLGYMSGGYGMGPGMMGYYGMGPGMMGYGGTGQGTNGGYYGMGPGMMGR